MMLVVSDASPLNILVRIGSITILPRLFDRVMTTPAVLQELSDPAAPSAVRTWVSERPDWLEVLVPTALVDASATGAGEREAISLALEQHADFLLVDDFKARAAARRLGLPLIGTLGVLERADEFGLLSLEHALAAIKPTDFRLAEELVEQALARARARRQSPPL